MTQEFRQLQGKISEVRKRLKWITAAKGLAISMALSLAVLVVAVFCADYWNYSDRAVTVARLVSVLADCGCLRLVSPAALVQTRSKTSEWLATSKNAILRFKTGW